VNPSVQASLEFAGIDPTEDQVEQITLLGGWLASEGVISGGVGPSEASRIDDRHLADSIVFAGAWASPPSNCWDLGSGVGLPGLILAILWPDCRLRLIDRSSKRVDLARRASRVVGVTVDTEIADITALNGQVEALVSRAAIPAGELLLHLGRLLAPGGLAVISGTESTPDGFEQLHVPAGILDHAPRLLMMRS
jgi:16S rRNA (guanine527-N7)-methyltransferase